MLDKQLKEQLGNDYQRYERVLKALHALDPDHNPNTLAGLQTDLERQRSRLDEDIVYTLAVIGQIKAGKSTLADVLFFDGRDTLPTGPTPTTSALTRLDHHPASGNQAVVHYYSAEDWQRIEAIARRHQPLRRVVELAKRRASNADDLITRGCADLVKKVKDSGLDVRSLLGKRESVAVRDLIHYAGPSSERSALIHHIDLRSDSDLLQDLRVVDTPGLNDTVVSREKITRDSLNEADSVFFLSQAASFLEEADVKTLRLLGQMGIDRVDVLASRFDEADGEPDTLLGEFQARLRSKLGIETTIVPVAALKAKIHAKLLCRESLSEDEEWYRRRFAETAPSGDLLTDSNIAAVHHCLKKHIKNKRNALAESLRKRCRAFGRLTQGFIKGMIDHREERIRFLQLDDKVLEEELRKIDETQRTIEYSVLRPEADQIFALFQRAFADFRTQLDTYFKGIVEDVSAMPVKGKNKPQHQSLLTRHRNTIDNHLASPRTYFGLEGDLSWLTLKARLSRAFLDAELPAARVAELLRDSLASEAASILQDFFVETIEAVYSHQKITKANEPVYSSIGEIIDAVWRKINHLRRESILQKWRGLRTQWNQAADGAVDDELYRERLRGFFAGDFEKSFLKVRTDMEQGEKAETIDQLRSELRSLKDLLALASDEEL